MQNRPGSGQSCRWGLTEGGTSGVGSRGASSRAVPTQRPRQQRSRARKMGRLHGKGELHRGAQPATEEICAC